MVIKHTHGKYRSLYKIVAFTSLFVCLFLTKDFTKAESSNTTFQVNVQEALTVSITTPENWASGTPTSSSSSFLVNTVQLSVTSNNSTGFTASMYSANNTNLANTASSSSTITTLESGTASASIPDGKWGYSLDVANGTELNNHSDYNNGDKYYPMSTSTTPIAVMTGTGATTGTRNIYFGAKAGMSQASGTYTGTVVINVVTGTVDDGNTGNTGTTPEVPTNPSTPTDTSTDNPSVAYNENGAGGTPTGNTVYTKTISSGATNQTYSEISSGDNTSAYSGYNYPQGVTTINEGTPLATGLAITSAIAATTGIVFFIIAKRREDEEDEDEY